jgi:hypothetical protein
MDIWIGLGCASSKFKYHPGGFNGKSLSHLIQSLQPGTGAVRSGAILKEFFGVGEEKKVAIAPFGFRKIEKLACCLLAFVGVVALLSVLDAARWNHFTWHFFLLALQSLAVIGGGVGAWQSTSLPAAVIGIASSLIAWTPVGHLTVLPGAFMMFLLLPRYRSFLHRRGVP